MTPPVVSRQHSKKVDSSIDIIENNKTTNNNGRKVLCGKTLMLVIGVGLLAGSFIGLHFLALNKSSSPSSHITNATNVTNNETNNRHFIAGSSNFTSSSNETHNQIYNESIYRSSVLSAIYNDTIRGSSQVLRMYNESLLVSDDGGSCSYSQESSACVYKCYYMFNPGTELGPFIENTENSLDCTTINVLIENSDFSHDTLSKGWLEYLGSKKITQLRLKDCNIKYIEDGALEGLEDLEKLYLENLLIFELRSAQIKNLRGLKELYLNYFDNLHSIESQILSNFPKLETLQMLDFKGLELVLPNITGNEVKHMTSVDFRDNTIDILKPQYFEGLNNCAAFYISRSNIKYIEPMTFYYPKTANLAKIDLSYNKLETLSEDAINFDHFITINLQNNPWRCNCSLAWLAKILNSNYSNKFEGEVVCKYPEGVKLIESGIIESCSPSISTSTTETTPTISTADTSETTTTALQTTTPTSTTAATTEPTESSPTPSEEVTTATPTTVLPSTTTPTSTTAATTEPTESSPTPSQEVTTTTPTTNTPDTTTSMVTTEKPPIKITASSPDCPRHDNIVSNEKRTNQNFEVDEKEVGTLSVQIPSYANGWRLYLREENENPCWYSTEEAAGVAFDLKLSEGQQYLLCASPEGRTIRYDDCQARTMQLQWENRPWIPNKSKVTFGVIAGVGVALLTITILASILIWRYHIPNSDRIFHVNSDSDVLIHIDSSPSSRRNTSHFRYKFSETNV